MSIITPVHTHSIPLWAPRVLPFACYIVFLAIGSSVGKLLPDPRWIYAIQIGSVAILLAVFTQSYSELRLSVKMGKAEWLWAIGIGVLVFVLWINLDLPFVAIGESTGFDPRTESGAIAWQLALMRLLGAVAVVPIMEELFWRSFLMRWIDKAAFLDTDPRRCSTKAILLSSLVFGFEHGLWFAGILAGLAYAWLYRRNGNLWMPIVAHAITNFLLGIWVLCTGNWHFW